ncbi:glycosyltransferase family 39 protein [Streptococcus sp. HF-100]|uniref:glycosyltransferase family 39 protein n=1 Tax=Streptococcus sp. HF-100 TaxID=2785791 RepID=UPI0018A08BFB|nr:glycosyltransferase family 39 protein [Streptococcus sp. HF-100]MBF7075748.1 hypothetical protein [Streptococcus sp. HF-100]
MLKMYSFFFSALQKIMLLIGLHWFFTAISHLGTISSLALIGTVILVFLAYRYLENLKKCYHYLMKHKVVIMIAVIIFQLAMLLSAQLLIRRDAAVVFNGAFKYLKESSISSYLTRNPNNFFLFLYERFFYNIFGSSALWILQGLNIFYADITALILYKGMKKYVSKPAADMTFSLYVLLVGFSPYFYSMYTDIWPLPLIALQIFLLFDLFELQWQDKRGLFIKTIGLGLISGLAVLIRPTVLIVIMAGFMLLFFKKEWKKFILIFFTFLLSFGVASISGNYLKATQREVTLIQEKGLSKSPLLFIDLGLTFIGHDQEDMKEGLLQYIDVDQREQYNNGMFKQENVKKEIKRRLKEYSFFGFLNHLYYKHSLTVSEGTLGWLYRDVEYEKTPYISPLYPYTKKNPVAQFIRTYFLSVDKNEYRYYEIVKQVIWIVMSLGLVFALWKYRADDKLNMLSLAVFGGLLFLLIFEGGKTRYLIQFLPQIIILSALGLTKYLPDWLKSKKGEKIK